MSDTLLVITPISSPGSFQLPLFSARGLMQTLDEIEPIGGTPLIRITANGGELDLTQPQFRKYKSTITCSDVNMPALDDSWRGAVVQVDCVHQLTYPDGGSPHRPLVPGTSATLENGFWRFYARLIMRVLDVRSDGFREWEAMYQWQMNLRENAPAA